MTKEREAIRMALEALELEDMACRYEKDPTPEHITKSITAIREVLAQPEQEPFGYFRYDLRLDAWVQNRAGLTGTPFYTTPQPAVPERKPMTDEEIRKLTGNAGTLMQDYAIKVARAVEAAHGITGETK